MLKTKPNVPLLGVIVFAAGGIFYYFGGLGIMVFGIIIAVIAGVSTPVAGLRESYDHDMNVRFRG